MKFFVFFALMSLNSLFIQSGIPTLVIGQNLTDRIKPIECISCKYYILRENSTETPLVTMRCPLNSPYCKIGEVSDGCSPLVDPFNTFCEYEPERFNCSGGPDLYPGNGVTFLYLLTNLPNRFSLDPLDCRRFFSCFTSIDVETCASGYFYSSKLKTCTKMTSRNQCYTSSCGKRAIQTWRPDPQFWVKCYNNVPLMNRCPKYETYTGGVGCRYKCPGEGFFQHDHKGQYYSCAKKKNQLPYTVKDCPDGSTFNAFTRNCSFP